MVVWFLNCVLNSDGWISFWSAKFRILALGGISPLLSHLTGVANIPLLSRVLTNDVPQTLSKYFRVCFQNRLNEIRLHNTDFLSHKYFTFIRFITIAYDERGEVRSHAGCATCGEQTRTRVCVMEECGCYKECNCFTAIRCTLLAALNSATQ
jgi:hypothetical protein